MKKICLIVAIGLLLVAALPAAAQDSVNPAPQQGQTSTLIVMPELLDRANNSFTDGDYSQATIDYSLFILLNPTVTQGYFSRALAYEALGNLDQAIQDLGRALDYKAPSEEYTSHLYLVRAQLYLDQNDLTSALSDLDASLEAFPDSVDSLSLRAQLLSFMQRFTDALDDYNRLIALEPDDVIHYLDRGLTHAQLGHTEDALADYSHAIEISPQDARPYAARAIYYTALRDFTGALDDINNAIDINPDIGEFYLVRGSINSVVDRPADAADDYFHWLTLNRTQEFVSQTALTQSQNFTIEMGPGWIYNIPFVAAQGQRVNIAASAASQQTPVDPLLVILGVNGSPLIADDDGGGNMAALIRNYEIPEDGEYTLVVGHAAGGVQEGNIAVQVELGAEE